MDTKKLGPLLTYTSAISGCVSNAFSTAHCSFYSIYLGVTFNNAVGQVKLLTNSIKGQKFTIKSDTFGGTV